MPLKQPAQFLLLMLAALLGGFLLYTTSLHAAEPRPLACPSGQTVFLEGAAPPGEALLTYLRRRPVGGGLADATGRYRVPLRIHERPGSYLVEVRLRSSRALIDSFTCFVDVPLGAAPQDTPVVATQRSVAPNTSTPTLRPGVTNTSTPTSNSVPTMTPLRSPRTPTVTMATAGTPTPTGSRTTTTTTTTTITPGTLTTTPVLTNVVVIDEIRPDDPIQPDRKEVIRLKNTGKQAVDLAGWQLSNADRTNIAPFSFPSYRLEVNAVVNIYSANGTNNLTTGDFYWGYGAMIWQVGNKAELRDSRNMLVATKTVSAP